ncbi:MAG: helix-turn-helix domain-containing protein [Thermoplasmatota archaeon]
MLQVTLAVDHGCALGELTRSCPEARVAAWCNYHHDALEITLDGSGSKCLDSVWKIAPGASIRQDPADPRRYHALFPCIHERSEGGVQAYAEEFHCIALSPIVYENGWETHRLVAWDDNAFRGLYERLASRFPVEIRSKRQLQGSLFEHSMILSANDILGDLTERQMGALEAAVLGGYYDVPRRTRVQDLADAAGTPRTTFQEHLQKGEAKLIQSITPLLGLRRALGGDLKKGEQAPGPVAAAVNGR